MSLSADPSSARDRSADMVVLEVQGLAKTFGHVIAVSNVDLLIKQGEFVTLLGPSGCGKSTLLRMVAGIDRPTIGTVAISGRIVSDVATKTLVPPERRGLGMVFQSYAVWPHMNVWKNVEYPLRFRRITKNLRLSMVKEALQAVRLTGLEGRYPSELSGGQQQRVALARAIVARPDLLLLDEPVSNLDAPLRAEMRRELKRLQVDLGLTALYVTHDQSEALAMSDRVFVMDAGRVLQTGTPESVYQRPSSLAVARFLGMKNVIEGELAGRSQVRVADALVEVSLADPGMAVGDRVVLAVRPEGFRLADASSPGALSGRVDLVQYVGLGYEHQVTLDFGPAIVVHGQRQLGERGNTISLTLDPSTAIAFPAEDQ